MRRYLALATMLILIGFPVRAAQLVMLEAAGCEWCELWDAEVGIIYAKTDQGKRAPLIRRDLDSFSNEEFKLRRGVHYTPTFILVENAAEIGRIEGYPGEAFFWELLDQILDNMEGQ